MERIEFTNKIWISQKKGFWYRFFKIMVYIGCVLQLFILLMDGIKGGARIKFIFTVGILIWCLVEGKRHGRYVESSCILRFSTGELEWEYPELKTEKGSMHVIYKINKKIIKDIVVSHEMKSLRLNSRPIMIVENKKQKVTDFSGKKKDCVLVLYYDDIDNMVALFEQYLGVPIDTFD